MKTICMQYKDLVYLIYASCECERFLKITKTCPYLNPEIVDFKSQQKEGLFGNTFYLLVFRFPG